MNDPRYPIGRFAPPASMTPELRTEYIAVIAATPARLREAVKGLTPERLQTAYREGGWTVAQVVHHLPDSHMNSYIRFKLAMTETQPTIKPYDEALWAELSDAAAPEIDASLDLLDALHRRWAGFLRSMSERDFERVFTHPERGASTLDRTLGLYAWHGEHHIAHIRSLRERMGW